MKYCPTYEKELAIKHVEAATGPNELLQPEVSSTAGGMGEAADGKIFVRFIMDEPIITNPEWIQKFSSNGVTESLSCGEITA